MLRSAVVSRSSSLASHRLAMVGLALGLALSPGCKNKGEDSTNPDEAGSAKTAAEVEASIQKAKDRAKLSELIRLANQDLANGRYVSAQNRADEALIENPDNADAYAVLGAARWRAGNFDGSTEAYRQALDIDDKNFGASLGLVRNLQAIGNHSEAIEIADRLLAEDKEQLDPYLSKLWSYYATCDADNAVKAVDEIFPRMGKKDGLLPLVQSFAAFVRPLEGKGPLCVVEGDKGTSTLQLDAAYGLKYSGAVVGSEFAPVIFFETREEAVVDSELVKTLGLPELAKYKPPGAEEEVAIVLIPEVKFGNISIKNVPASVQPLSVYSDALGGETPGVILGRQAMQAFGGVSFDFPGSSVELSKAAPTGPADGDVELPLVMLSMYVAYAPVVPISIDGSDHSYFAYLGSTYGAGLSVTKKQYLKSGHLPRQIDPPDDPAAGLKMVYVDSFTLGDVTLSGTSGLVLVNEPADPTIEQFLRNTLFEVGGHINLSMLRTWRVNYALGSGKVFIKPS